MSQERKLYTYVPVEVLRNMFDHALDQKKEWELSRRDAEKRLISANEMVTHWSDEAIHIEMSLEALGEFEDEQN